MSERNDLNVSNNAQQQTQTPNELATIKKSSTELTKPTKKKKFRLSWLTILILVADIIAVGCFYVFYGPNPDIRDWYITTAISTNNHQYLAYILYNQETIDEVRNRNYTIAAQGTTDVDAIQFVENKESGVYTSVYDQQILERDEGQLYKIIEFEEDAYKGYVVAVYDPTRLKLAQCKSVRGETILQMAKDNNAIIAVNAGGYRLRSNGDRYNMGSIIQNGKIFKDTGEVQSMICLTKDGKLLLANDNVKNLVQKNVDWGIYFRPFLIVNGNKATFSGKNPGGVHPRTAIGQRKDGIIIFVVIDGRGGGGSKGINMRDLTDILERYGCYNAANLDGGGSSELVEGTKVRNNPVSYQYTGERRQYNCIILK